MTTANHTESTLAELQEALAATTPTLIIDGLIHEIGLRVDLSDQQRRAVTDVLHWRLPVYIRQGTANPARSTDRATSHRAGAKHRTDPHRFTAKSAKGKLLLHIASDDFYQDAFTAVEAASHLIGGYTNRETYRKRVNELAAAGYLRPVGVRRDILTGNDATTYELTREGCDAAERLRKTGRTW